MKFYDISPMISEKIAVFPGDCEFSRNVSMSYSQGHHLDLSSVKTTLHVGAHADSPAHYNAEGETIETRSLDYYYGPCQVIHVDVKLGERVRPEHVEGKDISAERVLFFTNSFPDPNKWNSDFCSLSPELIDILGNKKVKLVGIDTPSVDPETSKELESHNQIYKHDMAILEGVVLSEVPEGIYQLIALPLKIEGADASPVRAVLVKN